MMDHRILNTLEKLEDRIEKIKWLITAATHTQKSEVSNIIALIRRSSGLLSKKLPVGISFENKIRKEWRQNFLKRTA